jgi:cellobiose phosphorylase
MSSYYLAVTNLLTASQDETQVDNQDAKRSILSETQKGDKIEEEVERGGRACTT